QFASTLASVARAADDAGYASIWLMDHFFQISSIGKAEEAMLEAYTTLGFMAAHTRRARLGTLVTGVHYRHPGVLVKQVTTLDAPAPISQPHPPILIGGGGERKTLRLVAQYADACNLFTRYPRRDLARKLTKLRRFCEEAGRSFDAIDRTCLGQWDPVRKSPQ